MPRVNGRDDALSRPAASIKTGEVKIGGVKRGRQAQDEVADIASKRPGADSSEAVADHRPDVYVDDQCDPDTWPTDDITGVAGPVVYRLSRLMSCRKALVATRLGIEGDEPPPWLMERFKEGANAEADILNRLFGNPATPPVKGGCPGGEWKLLDPSDRQSYKLSKTSTEFYPYVKPSTDDDGTGQFIAEVPMGKGRIARGHLDGIAQLYAANEGWQTGMRAVVEVKYLATAQYKQWVKDGMKMLRNNPSYGGQASGYGYATGLPMLYVVAEKVVVKHSETEGMERAGDEEISIGEIFCFFIPVDEYPVSIGKMKAQVAYVEKYAAMGDMGDCAEEMWPCPIWWLHTGEGRDANDQREADVPSGMTETFVEGVAAYNKGARLEREGKAEKVKGKELLEKVVAEAGIGDTGGMLKSDFGNVEWVVEEVPGSVVERKAYSKRYPKIGKGFKADGES